MFLSMGNYWRDCVNLPEGYQYDAYLQALRETYGIGESSQVLLYDLAFLASQEPAADGEEAHLVEVQPAEGSVDIQFTFKQPQAQVMALQEGGGQQIRVLHLPLSPEVREQTDTTAQATEISAGDIQAETVEAQVSGDCVEFSLDSFSLVAFVTQEDGSVVPVTDVTPGLGYTYRDVLGSAINYGITARKCIRSPTWTRLLPPPMLRLVAETLPPAPIQDPRAARC